MRALISIKVAYTLEGIDNPTSLIHFNAKTMSCNVGDYISCPDIQKNFAGHFDQISGLQRENSPFTDFLMTPENTDGVLRNQIDVGGGKLRTVVLTYESRFTENQVTSDATQTCNTGAKPGETSAQYQLDPSVGSKFEWSIDVNDLIQRCEDDQTFFSRQLMKAFDVLSRKINTDNWTAAASLLGVFPTTSSSTAVKVQTQLNNGAYSPDAIQKVRYEFGEMEWNGGKALFGNGLSFQSYFESMAGMCCNSVLGVNIPEIMNGKGILPIYDRKSADALGTNHFLAMRPGALQFIYWNQFGSPKQQVNDSAYYAGVVVDPFSGIPYDYTARFDCGVWSMTLKLAHMLVGVPNDLWCADDRLSGVTFVNDFEIDNPEICDCPAS